MLEKIKALPGLRDVTGDLYVKNPQMTLEIDRAAAAVYGVTVDQVRQELYNCFGSRQVGTIYTASNDYQVILECDKSIQVDPTGLSKIYVKTNTNGAPTAAGAPAAGSGIAGATSPNGPAIPLSAVTKLTPTLGALQVNHQGQQPSMTVSFNLAPNFPLGAAVDAIKEIERQSNLPASVVTGFQGAAQVFQDSLKGQGVLVLAAVFASFVVLGILYESFIHPITIISGLPSAGVGALLVLMMFGMDLSVIAMIGIVMLVGIVKKNAIMMIDFALQRRAVGLGAEEAIREACLLRFRPIMMTTFAAVFGALPIAVGAGAGAELRQPLGVAVVGGLCVSQLLTLYITPVVYIYLDRLDRILKRRLEPPADLGRASRASRSRTRWRRSRGGRWRQPPRGAAPSSLQRKARPAAAGRGRDGVVDAERRPDEVVDEVDLGARHVLDRDRIDQHRRPFPGQHEVVVAAGLIEVEFVLKAGAAAALDAHPQHGAGRLPFENLADPPCRPFRQDYIRHGRFVLRSLAPSRGRATRAPPPVAFPDGRSTHSLAMCRRK